MGRWGALCIMDRNTAFEAREMWVQTSALLLTAVDLVNVSLTGLVSLSVHWD